MKEKIFNIEKNTTTFLKGIAILSVVLGHMGYIHKGGCFGVSLFLLLSGYGVFKSYLSSGTKDFFKKKIKKVYIPYLLVTIFVLLFSFFKNKISSKVILFSLLGLDFGNLCDLTMWYISFIFLEYLIFYISILLFKGIKKDNLKHILMIIFCIITNYIVHQLDNRIIIWHLDAGAFLYTFTFSTGLILAKLNDYKMKVNVKKIILSISSFIMLLITLYFYNKDMTDIYTYTLYVNTVPLLIIFLFEIFKFNIKDKNIISIIGKDSYDIYLWEGFFLLYRNTWFSPFKYQILIDIITIITCYFFAILYRKVIINLILKDKR